MFRELIYYSSVFTLSGFLGYQILNYLNPSLTGSILYNSVKTYHYCRRELDKALDKYNYDTIKDVKKEVELKPVNTYVGYKVVDDTTHTCTDVKNNYLNTENLILGLTYKNYEIDEILSKFGHLSCPADSVSGIKNTLNRIFNNYEILKRKIKKSTLNPQQAVDKMEEIIS